MALAAIQSRWGDTFSQVGQKYGLDPDLLLAIAAQENVNPAYNNPLGRSGDSGVYHYGSFDEGAANIENQAKLLTNPNGPYSDFVKTGSVYDLSKVYSPPGAKNDVNQTNASEPSGILANLARIKGTSVADLTGGHAAAAGATAGVAAGGSPPPAQITPTSPAAPSYLTALTGGSTGNPQLDRINQLSAAMKLSGNNPVGNAIAQGLQIAKIGQALRLSGIFGAPRAQLVSLPSSTTPSA
jgi:hypothetical protein